ncbi:MAG: hypothetical protein QOH80_1627 [Actinomycetota bacterium]|nr:hypothetical protein [Actinomycetota bacterium]
MAASRTLVTGLVDDAALFPPGNAPMPLALAEHALHRRSWYAELVGPFVCPTSRVAELLADLAPEAAIDVSLVLDEPAERLGSALGAVGHDERVTLRGVEARLARLGVEAAAVGSEVRRVASAVGFLEVPRDGVDDTLSLIGGDGWAAAKYRTGGTTADAFPTENELAAFLAGVAKASVAFKLTAGLHHAVRHTAAETGFEHHGVLNILVATADAVSGAPAAEVAETLSHRDPATLVSRIRSLSSDQTTAVRSLFRSFGCCGVTEPIEDLRALGVVVEEKS